MKYFLLSFLVVLFFIFYSVFKTEGPNQLKIGSKTLNIEVADTDEERILGLSGRTSLGENDGLLFVFKKEGKYGFWMKDMNFPIDIIWIGKDKKIVHVESNVLPSSYPKVFFPQELSLYVLEVSAGFLNKNNIKIGDFVDF